MTQSTSPERDDSAKQLAPLEGILVLDVSTALAGPTSATALADLGARVIKVEKPNRGDLTRHSDQHVQGESGYFLGVNPGKEGMTLDLRLPEGQEILRCMTLRADILIQNYRPGAMDAWGLGFERLSAENPRLIYCSITAYGESTGFGEVVGNDLTVQGFSGLMDLTGEADGPPLRIGSSLTDVVGGLHATVGMLAALHRRTLTGVGEHVSVSLIESGYSLLPNLTTTVLNNPDIEFRRLGTGHPQLVPYQAFACKDDAYIILGAFHNTSWEAVCHCIGRRDLLADERYTENWKRVIHREELHATLRETMKQKTRDEWMSIFKGSDAPVAPILRIRESIDRFAASLPTFVNVAQHADIGPLRVPRPVVQFAVSPLPPRTRAAPRLGEHTSRLLAEFGYTEADLMSLKRNAVI